MGAEAHNEIEFYTTHLPGGTIVEIGAGRYEGQSSHWFLNFVKDKPQYTFYCIEKDLGTYQDVVKMKEALGVTNAHIWNDSWEAMADIPTKLNYVYLDNFDYIPLGCENADWMLAQIENYKKWGVDLNNENSAAAHLQQAQLAITMADTNCIILFDDTFKLEETTTHTFVPYITPDMTGWYGKGATAVPWLIEQGWRLLPKDLCVRGRDDWTALANF